MSVKIIVDSTTDLLPSIREQVTVVPLTVCFGQEEFTDGVTITHEQFQKITEYLKKKKSSSLLAIQISYYA